jgi:hypothetical protein
MWANRKRKTSAQLQTEFLTISNTEFLTISNTEFSVLNNDVQFLDDHFVQS